MPISVECCQKEEEEEGEDMVDGGRGIDQTDHQREGGRRRVYAKETSSIQHIKIPMVNKKAVKFR